MHATYWLIGCALCIASAGATAGTSVESQDMDDATHATVDSGSLHDGGSDVLGLTRGSSQRSPDTETPASTSSSGEHAGGVSTAVPVRAHQPHVGWQSLLPGSIQ